MKTLIEFISEANKNNKIWAATMANDIDDSNLLDVCHYMIAANAGKNKGINTIYISYEDLKHYLYNMDKDQLQAEYDSLVDLLGKQQITQIIQQYSLSKTDKSDVLSQCYIDMLRWMDENDKERLEDIWPNI